MNIVNIPHKKRAPASIDEGMIPAINIVFLLLIFFMISGHIQANRSALELPASKAEQDELPSELLLEITADKQFFLNHQEISPNLIELSHALEQLSGASLSCHVHRALPISVLDKVLQIARTADLKRIQIRTIQQ
jgi:biopolymer transport protein ExbD